jgi:hypothetical protein
MGTRHPACAERELRRKLGCGILAYGFARARCSERSHDVLAAFPARAPSACCARPGAWRKPPRISSINCRPTDSLLAKAYCAPGAPVRGRLCHERTAPQPNGLRHPLAGMARRRLGCAVGTPCRAIQAMSSELFQTRQLIASTFLRVRPLTALHHAPQKYRPSLHFCDFFDRDHCIAKNRVRQTLASLQELRRNLSSS